jgi:hypothetical protein
MEAPDASQGIPLYPYLDTCYPISHRLSIVGEMLCPDGDDAFSAGLARRIITPQHLPIR